MKTFFSLIIAAALMFGCATSGSSKRPAYTGTDSVSTIDPDMLIGIWNTRILNPVKGEESANGAVVEYREDGTVLVNSEFDSGMGIMQMEVSGTWSINGEVIEQKATDVREKSGNAMGALVKVFKGTMLKNANATLNVYEATGERLVIVSDSGQAQELTRAR